MTATTKQQWIPSTKRNPCPVCGRVNDDKCRRSEYLLCCYWGERFAPPAGLKLGQVLDIEDHRWAVVNLAGGFAGNCLILRPHIDRHDFKPAQRQQRQREAAVLAPALREVFGKVRAYVHASLAVQELEQATADELCRDQQLLAATMRHLQELRVPLVQARREDPSLARMVSAVDHWLRLLSFQAADLEAFNRLMLGTPSPDAIAALRREAA